MPRLKTQYLGKITEVSWSKETVRNRLVEELTVTMTMRVGRAKTTEEAMAKLEELRQLIGRDATVFIQ